MKILLSVLLLVSLSVNVLCQPVSTIRINQLGYASKAPKVAVFGTDQSTPLSKFYLIDAKTGSIVFAAPAGKNFGKYGPFKSTYRLNFSSFQKQGKFLIKAGTVSSPSFLINDHVYDGTADFCLRYMRQQRSGFNPYLKDSCHTFDGYTLYAPVPDSTHIDVVGGWHDATDYLQYSATSANATYQLLAAYRDFPHVFSDEKQVNGLDGKNNQPDVLDEAKWGLEWLLKMHPKKDWLFNQLGDDRDHRGMRLPKQDTNFYNRGFERPVYFCNGLPQVRGKFMNNTTGVASTAGKFASAFSLGSKMFATIDKGFAALLQQKALTAYQLGIDKPGNAQTASVVSPYIYAEDNWTDDMELAAAALFTNQVSKQKNLLAEAYQYALQEKVTPWMGTDTAKHYQWYPFINVGHYELAKSLQGKKRDSVIQFYKDGIERVWKQAKNNAFYRNIPFIWCSNNLTVSFAVQCYLYRRLTGDETYRQLEQSCFDWIFGCNPWGTSMVYGLPSWGDTPVDPHSSFTHIANFPIDGGLVDGPVYTSIYKNLIGIELHNGDEYAPYQSDLAVYHDDYGDYSTNEPTMDGTASLIYLLAAEQVQANAADKFTYSHGAIVRADSTKKEIALVFTGDEFGEGLPSIIQTLQSEKIKAGFFFTGNFYHNPAFKVTIKALQKGGHYLGPHSDKHLLYNDWSNRDSLLVTKPIFQSDLEANLAIMQQLGIKRESVKYFIPPYEWWNDSIAAWSKDAGLQLINFTPGISTNADYTFPSMGSKYKSSTAIIASVKEKFKQQPSAFNGAIVLIHAGTDPARKDKLYDQLDSIIRFFKSNGYSFKSLEQLFSVNH